MTGALLKSTRQAPGCRAVLASLFCLLVSIPTDHLGAQTPSIPRPETRRNLVLLTLDTVRADALGVNGSRTARTPNLDRLARTGVNFTLARAPAPLTLPSHASILTGLYPPAHGVRDNGAYRLADEQVALAEVLREQGYETAAFVGSFVLDRRFGLAQGFDLYDDDVTRDPAMLERYEAERPAGAVFEAFDRWLGVRDQRSGPASPPFFAWLHLYDPHAPYEPPEPFASRYAADPYAGEIAYVDEIAGRVVDALDRRGLAHRTLLAVAGDHGEGLGQHGEATHALFIYNSTLHVPLLLHAPGLLPVRVEVDEVVRLIDLAPTLLDYLGIPAALGEGVSLRPLVRRYGREGEGEPVAGGELTAYGESLYGELHLRWSPLYALESEGFKLILAPQPELYDLAADPGETTNLYAARPEVARRLQGELGRIADLDAPRDPVLAAPPDDETAARLRSLGYLSGSRPASRPGREGTAPDPKGKLAVWQQIQLATAHLGRGDDRTAAQVIAELLAAEPDIPLLYDYLGAAYVRLGEWAEAERVYRLAIDRGLATAANHAELGFLLARRDDAAAAEQAFLTAIQLDPASVVAHHRLGDLYRRTERHPDAIEHYRQALEINPAYVFAWNGLGMALAASGADDAALAAFRQAVEEAPANAPSLYNLAVQLERMARRTEALALYRRVIDLTRDDPALDAELRQATAAAERLVPNN